MIEKQQVWALKNTEKPYNLIPPMDDDGTDCFMAYHTYADACIGAVYQRETFDVESEPIQLA
jgi:hypothetical protein